MPTIKNGSVQDQILSAVQFTQKATVEAVNAWAEAVGALTPAKLVPAFPEGLPKPQDAVKTVFSFAEQVLQAQRQFVDQLISALEPVTKQAA